MPFDPESFKRNREREITLSDGNTVIVRRPGKELATIIINTIGHRMTPSQHMMAEKMQAAGLKGEDITNEPEFWAAHEEDFRRWVYACICYSPTEPKFVTDEADAVDGKLWVELLGAVPEDALAVVSAIWEFLGLSINDGRVLAPFHESGRAEPAGGTLGHSPAESVA